MSSPHVFDELPLVLTGEADRSTVHHVAEHLRRCEDCRQDLVSALVAHASLSSAARHAPELAAPDLILGVRGEVHDDDLPDISSILDEARAEAKARLGSSGDELSARRSRRGRGLSIAAAAVVVAAAGVGGGLYAAHGNSDNGSTVRIGAFGIGTTSATATIKSGEVKLDAASLPAPSSGHYYRVWLTDASRRAMLALGTLSPTEQGDFTVGNMMIDQYTAIEVSLQSTAASPVYSGVSVLRGTYQA